YIGNHPEPLVVKASGLAGGKGAVVCQSRVDAAKVVRAMLDGSLGEAGKEVLVEQFLEGEELSVLALTDGERVLILPPAQDYKRLGEGDTGPNTGGMGAYCPVSVATDALVARAAPRGPAPDPAGPRRRPRCGHHRPGRARLPRQPGEGRRHPASGRQGPGRGCDRLSRRHVPRQ